jgi:hypothetical protein
MVFESSITITFTPGSGVWLAKVSRSFEVPAPPHAAPAVGQL